MLTHYWGLVGACHIPLHEGSLPEIICLENETLPSVFSAHDKIFVKCPTKVLDKPGFVGKTLLGFAECNRHYANKGNPVMALETSKCYGELTELRTSFLRSTIPCSIPFTKYMFSLLS